MKEASEASGIKYLLYPQGGIDRYSLYDIRVQKFLSEFYQDSPDNPDYAS
jgi:allantoicase